MRKKGLYKQMYCMIYANFDCWVRSPRTILMIVFTIATTWMIARGYINTLEYLDFSMNYSESMAYVFMTGLNGIGLSSLTFLVMISEIPRRIPFQQYTIIRSSRMKWISAQILYCLLLVIVMLLLNFIISSIFIIPYTSEGTLWSDNLRIEKGMETELALIPKWVRAHYTPWQAFAVSVLPIFLFWFVMILTQLLFSLLGKPAIGTSIYSVVLFSSIIFYFESFIGFEPPMTFTTLLKIVYQYEDVYQNRLITVFSCYGAIIVALISAIMFIAKRMDTPIYSMNKV